MGLLPRLRRGSSEWGPKPEPSRAPAVRDEQATVVTSLGPAAPAAPVAADGVGAPPAQRTGSIVRARSFLPAVIADRVPASIAPAVDALPGLARIAASTAYHTAGWGVGASARTTKLLARAMVDPDAAAELSDDLNEAGRVLRQIANGVGSGLAFHEAVAAVRGPDAVPVPEHGVSPRESEEQRLRAKGARLLERSRDVWQPETGHPAYERILEELAPDEARILVLLLKDGPQPSVDVRTGGPTGMLNSHLVARGLNMIGARAGLRSVDAVPQYLNNLSRLGLVWQSSEALEDLLRYQVVEAQPDVLSAMHSVKFPKVLRRSLHLTPFGVDFARMCFAGPEETDAFPQHLSPPITSGEKALPRE